VAETAHDAHDESVPLEPDKSLGELFGQLSSDFGQLISTQVELAKLEIKEEANRAARSAGMMAAAAVAGVLTLLLASFTLAWGLNDLFDSIWLGFLIVTVLYAIVAAVLFAIGRGRLKDVKPMPETMNTVKEDLQWARQQAS
jgi:uncharacterized membrane protein YqjE